MQLTDAKKQLETQAVQYQRTREQLSGAQQDLDNLRVQMGGGDSRLMSPTAHIGETMPMESALISCFLRLNLKLHTRKATNFVNDVNDHFQVFIVKRVSWSLCVSS